MNGKREPQFVVCYLCERRMNSESLSNHCKSRKHNKLLHEAQGLARFWIKVTGSPSVFLKEDIIRSIFEKQGKIQRIIFNNGAFYIRYLRIKHTLTALDNAYRGDYRNIVNLKLKVESVFVSPSQPMEVDVFQVEPENNALDDFRNILSHTIRTIQSTPTQAHSFESIANQIVSSILSYAENESGSNQVYSDLTHMFSSWCANVQRELRLNVTVQVYVFGSVEIGLALSRFSDIDVYIDVGNTYLDMLHETTRLLFQNSDKFHDIVTIKGARVPIVKAVHSQSDIPIDISFKSKLGWYNTQLIKFYVKYDSRVKTLLALIKIWFKRVELNDTRAFTSYSIYWLALFYLQQLDIPLIPSVRQLLQFFPSTQCLRWKVMHPEEMQRTVKEYPRSKNSLSLEKLLLGFFQFYAELDLKNVVLCPLLGKVLPRSVFEPENLDQLPREMDGYHRYAQEFPKDTLKISSQMCVQDPYDLSHNITKAVNHASISLLMHHLDTVWILYKRNPAQILLSLLEDSNRERDTLLHEFDVENETLRLQRLLAACKKARERKEAREKESQAESPRTDGSPSTRNSKKGGDNEQKSNPKQTSPSKSSDKQASNSKVMSDKQTRSSSSDNCGISDSTETPLEDKADKTSDSTTSKLKNSSDSDKCSEPTGVKSNSSDNCSQQKRNSTQKNVNSSTDSGSFSQQKYNFDCVGLSLGASTQTRPGSTSKKTSNQCTSGVTSKNTNNQCTSVVTSSRQQKISKYSSGEIEQKVDGRGRNVSENEQKFDGRGRKSPERVGRRTLVITNSKKHGSPNMGLRRQDGETGESRISTHKDNTHMSSKEKSGQNTSSRENFTSDLSEKLDRGMPNNRNRSSTNQLSFSEIVSNSHKKPTAPTQSNSKSTDPSHLTNRTDSIQPTNKKDSNTNRQVSRQSTSEQGTSNNSYSQGGNDTTSKTTHHSQATNSGDNGNTPSQSTGSSSIQNITKEEIHHPINKSVENKTHSQNNKFTECLLDSRVNSSVHLNQLVNNIPMSNSSSNASNNIQSQSTATEGTSHTQSPPRDINLIPSANNMNDQTSINPLLQMFYNLAKPSTNGSTGCVPTTLHPSQLLQANHQHLERLLQTPIVQSSPYPSQQHFPTQTTTKTSPPGFPPMFPVSGPPHPVTVPGTHHPVTVPGNTGHPVNVQGPPGIPVNIRGPPGIPVNSLENAGLRVNNPMFPISVNALFAPGNPMFPVGSTIGNALFPGTPANSTMPGLEENPSVANLVGTPPGFLGNSSNVAVGNSSVFPGNSSRFPVPASAPVGTPSGMPGSPLSSSSSSSSSILETLQRLAINSPQNTRSTSELHAKNVAHIENKLLGNIGSLSGNSANNYQTGNANMNSNNPNNNNYQSSIGKVNTSPSSVQNVNSGGLNPNSNQITNSNPLSNAQINSNCPNSVNVHHPSNTFTSSKAVNSTNRQTSANKDHNIEAKLQNLKQMIGSMSSQNGGIVSLKQLKPETYKIAYIDVNDLENNLKKKESLHSSKDSLNSLRRLSESAQEPLSRSSISQSTSKNILNSNTIAQTNNTSRHSRERMSQMKNTSGQSKDMSPCNTKDTSRNPRTSQMKPHSSSQPDHSGSTNVHRADTNSIRRTKESSNRNTSAARLELLEKRYHNETNFKNSSVKSRNTNSEYERHELAKQKEGRPKRVESSQMNTKDRKPTENESRKESLSRNTSKNSHSDNMKAPTREVPAREAVTNGSMVNGHRELSDQRPPRRDTYHIQADHKRKVTIFILEPDSVPDVLNFFNIANEVLVEYLEQVCLLQVHTKVYATETEFLYRGEHGIDVCHNRKKLLGRAGFNPPRALNHSKFQVEILKTNFLLMNAREALVKNNFVVSIVSRLVSRRGGREIQVSLVNENLKEEMSQYLSFVAFFQNGFDVIYKEMKKRCQPRPQ
uniref:Poly(A) RNA polymerase gld-2 homolog B n=1 Tax=Cacopsylla melanoneura TaxID=428564 RepID=A0A8D8QVW5_9HEMI